MSMNGPIEIYGTKIYHHFFYQSSFVHLRSSAVDTLSEPPTFSSVRETLMRIVPLCLDSDPSLIPLSCKVTKTPALNESIPLPTTDLPPDYSEGVPEQELRDPDDFSFWSEKQAKRICIAIRQIFGVEYVPDVIVADANLTALANRILVSKDILSSSSGP
jgi:phosphatidylethanolamine N-methyltransferase